MSNEMLYNKERPKTFGDIGGNAQITDLLRLLIKNKATKNTHYIFSGHPGTGKTTVGRVLARAINCITPDEGEPCNKCKNCELHLAESYSDYIEIDATSYNKVEDAKRLVDLASQYPINPNGQRVILLDEAHVLSNAAFDKFLKLLESGDVRTTFIFCTTDIHLFRPAIVSRCFDFTIKPLSGREISKEILRICTSNSIEYTKEAINKLSHHYAGQPRAAIKHLDLYVKAQGHFTTYEVETQESILLQIFKLAYYNKVEDYIDALELVDASNIFRNVCRMLNELFLYPHIQNDLLQSAEIEAFKTLIDNANLKSIIRDIIQLKPDDIYSLTLMLATITELGMKLSSKETKRKAHTGRRFVGKNAEQQERPVVEIVATESTEPEGIDIESMEDVPAEKPVVVSSPNKSNKLTVSDLSGFGFKEVVADAV